MDKGFSYDLMVRWGDLDALGHVNHTKYLTYCEQARVVWWQSIGLNLTQTTGPILVHLEANYLSAITEPIMLTIKLCAHSPGRSSYLIDYEIFAKETCVATASTKIVWVDYQQGKSTPLPEWMLAHIRK